MITRYVGVDELYPFLTIAVRQMNIDGGISPPLELSEEDLADYERVMREFEAWQKRLEAARWPD